MMKRTFCLGAAAREWTERIDVARSAAAMQRARSMGRKLPEGRRAGNPVVAATFINLRQRNRSEEELRRIDSSAYFPFSRTWCGASGAQDDVAGQRLLLLAGADALGATGDEFGALFVLPDVGRGVDNRLQLGSEAGHARLRSAGRSRERITRKLCKAAVFPI